MNLKLYTILLFLVFSNFKVTANGSSENEIKHFCIISKSPDSLPLQAFQISELKTSAPTILNKTSNHKSLEGIDVSHYQGIIDWNKVKKKNKITYVYIKATEKAL